MTVLALLVDTVFQQTFKQQGHIRHSHIQSHKTLAQSNTTTTTSNKWVINLSFNPITKAQETLLAKGPYFAIVPKCSPKEAYITAVEKLREKN